MTETMWMTAPDTQPEDVKDTDFVVLEFVCPDTRLVLGSVAKGADWKMAKRYFNMGDI